MQNKPLIIQACETLGVPPGIKVTDLRALVELKLKILPEGSKEANMTRLAYDLLSTKLPETRIQEYNQAAFEWAKETAMAEQGGQPTVSVRPNVVPVQPAVAPVTKTVQQPVKSPESAPEEIDFLALGKAQLRELVKRDGKNAPAWAVALSR
jgi:hypothetical protein